MKPRIIATALLLSLHALLIPHDAPAPAYSAPAVQGGSLERREGYPIVRLSGSHYEMGRQYGALMKNEIIAGYREMDQSIDAIFSFVHPLIRPLARWYYHLQARRKARLIPQRFREELRGVAEASGIDEDRIIRMLFAPDLVGGLACTSVLVKRGGTIIHGRNLDFPPTALGRYPVIIEYHPTGGRGYTLVNIAGYLPALSGLNDAGISVTLNLSFLVDKNRKHGMPVGYKIREILESAETMGDVDRLLEGYATDEGWILTVASGREGKGAIYDIAGAESRKTNMTGPYCFAVNRFQEEDMNRAHKHVDDALGDYNDNRALRLNQLLPGVRDAAGMARLLGDTDYRGRGHTLGVFTINNYETVQSMVILPATGEIYLASAPMYAGLARMIRYQRATGAASVFRPAHPLLAAGNAASLLAWADKLYVNPRAALANIDQAGRFGVKSAYALWKIDSEMVDTARLLAAVQRELDAAPRDAFLCRIMGHILMARGRYAEAAKAIEAGLHSPSAAPGDLMMSHAFLAASYLKVGNREKAKHHARLSLEIMDGYQLNKEEKRLRRECEKILK